MMFRLLRWGVSVAIFAFGIGYLYHHTDIGIQLAHATQTAGLGRSSPSAARASQAISKPHGAYDRVGFSPGDALSLVLHAIDHAHRSILVAAYSFTSRPIARALLEARKRGVKVNIVMDKSQRTAHYSKSRYLARKGIPERIDSHYAIMHNKFMVIDGSTVETGSFNYTYSAHARNAENVIVLHNQPRVAHIYTREWRMLWNQSQPFTGGS